MRQALLALRLLLPLALLLDRPMGAAARVRPAELEALMHLYASASGASWADNGNWDAEKDCCRKTRAKRPYRWEDDATEPWVDGGNAYFEPTPFFGVGCLDPCDDYLDGPGCTAGRVTSLVLRNHGLEGSTTDWVGVGEMRNLTFLDLSYNMLSGSIPTQLGRINNLHILQLRDNAFSGDLPAELADVNANGVGELEEVSLANNRLTGHLPPSWLAHNASLLSLDVGNNSLSGTLPASYGRLPRLQVFYLRQNSLSGTLPATWGAGGGLGDVRYFEVQGGANKLSGTLPTSIGELTSLQTLDMSELRLSGTLPTQLGALTNLRFLRLNDNAISGSIPTEIGRVRGLETLDLYNNDFVGDMPSEMGLLLNLRLLYLPNEQLLPLRMRYCQQRLPSLGKYSYRLVREEYYRMVSSICPEPFDTLTAFGTLDQISGDV